MNRLNPSCKQFTIVLRVLCAVAVLSAMALLAPADWRGNFSRGAGQ